MLSAARSIASQEARRWHSKSNGFFLNAETGVKRCLERTVTSAETQDRKKSGNRPAQSRQKVRFLIGGGFGETGWWARQGSNRFLAQKATLPICQGPSCNRSSFCAMLLKSFILAR